MPNFSPQLINILSQYFLRKGRAITGSDISAGSITKAKLAFPTVAPSDLTPIEATLEGVQSELDQLEADTSQSIGSLTSQIQSLQSSISDLDTLVSDLGTRVTTVEDILATGVATEEIRVTDENDPTNRIIITVTDGVVAGVTREVI